MPQAPLITPEMLHLIAQLDVAKGQWQALRNLALVQLLVLRHSATIESMCSSRRIEGGKLTNHEVERFLASLNQMTFATRDEQEVAGYARVTALPKLLSSDGIPLRIEFSDIDLIACQIAMIYVTITDALHLRRDAKDPAGVRASDPIRWWFLKCIFNSSLFPLQTSLLPPDWMGTCNLARFMNS